MKKWFVLFVALAALFAIACSNPLCHTEHRHGSPDWSRQDGWHVDWGNWKDGTCNWWEVYCEEKSENCDMRTCNDILPGGTKIEGPGTISTVINSPTGTVFDQVCVKAGSANQGYGPEMFGGCAGLTSCTIYHSSGKEISHYSYTTKTPPLTHVTASVAFVDPTCTTPASYTTGDTTGVDYILTGTVGAGESVTVTATAKTGYVLDGQSVFTHTFTTPDINVCDPLVTICYQGLTKEVRTSELGQYPGYTRGTCEPTTADGVDCTGVYTITTTETVPGPKVYIYEWKDVYLLETVTIGDKFYAEPPECFQCSMRPLYWQDRFIKEGQPPCYLVTWDQRKDGTYIPANSRSQLCNCGWIADNVHGGDFVYIDCHGTYWYMGEVWAYGKPDMVMPHWEGVCASGGGGGECPAK